MTFRRVLLALSCLPFAACATPAGNGGTGGSTGNGGSSATGGSTGNGGSSATGGSTGSGGAGAGLGTGVGHAFPLNMKTGSCMLTTVSGAATQTQSAYTSWRSTYVVSG